MTLAEILDLPAAKCRQHLRRLTDAELAALERAMLEPLPDGSVVLACGLHDDILRERMRRPRP